MPTLDLFGTLNLATRSLSAQRTGTEVAGHNLANVNTAGYTRQRVEIEAGLTIPSEVGPQGTGANAVAIRQIRDGLVDRRIVTQTSLSSSYETQQKNLEYVQANLGQQIDRLASGAEGAASTNSVGGQHGLAEALSGFFTALNALSTSSSPNDGARPDVLSAAAALADQFVGVNSKLTEVNTSLNDSIQTEVGQVNTVLKNIVSLNQQITATEAGSGGTANDLRDALQESLKELATHLDFTTTELGNGMIEVSIGGVQMNNGTALTQTLEAYDPGNGQLQLRTTDNAATPTHQPVTVQGGIIHGDMEVRDGSLSTLRDSINTLANALITSVNAQHAAGYDANGNAGGVFFTGTDAATIKLAIQDTNLIAAAGSPGASLDNVNANRLARLANDSSIPGLGGRKFNDHYNAAVEQLGNDLSTTNSNVNNNQVVQSMLEKLRDSVSGVSVDEEMVDLIKYQRAYEASARLISVLNEMLTTLVNLGR